MPSISLTDRLGLNFQVEPNTFSAIEKYFKIIPQLILREKTIDELRQLSLTDPAITSLHIGLDVNQPIPVGTSAVDFAINGGPSASVDIFVPSSQLQPGEADLLFNPDDFEEAVPVQQNERYVSVGLTATLDASIATGVSDLSFGFGASTSLSIVNYQKFTVTPTGPSVLDAIAATISKFQLPGDIEDLQSMAPDSIITLSGSGGLQFSATASLAVVSNPLATVDLGSVLPSIQIARGNSITVGAAFKQSGDFEVQIRKIAPHTVQLGYFKRRTSELDLSASAQAGISIAIGSEDLFGRVISAISPNAVGDLKELQAAQLDEQTISAIQATVKASIDRSLEVALSAEWDSLSSKKAAFLYEVDLTALDDAGRMAIHKALDGNLSDLIQHEDNLPSGIKMIRSIFTNLRQRKHALKINLLGIYNFISVSKLTLKGKVLFDEASGELTISDSAAATRFQTGALNVGGKPNRADPKQLRKALARYFLITASYRAAKCIVSPPELKSSYIYFDLHDSTNRETMQDELDLAVGLGLMTAAEQQQLTKSVGDFGRTLVYGRTEYNDQLTQMLFLNDQGVPRKRTEFENIGRQAMRVAIHSDSVDQFRLKPLQNDELWKKMTDIGQPGFGQIEIFKNLNATQLGAITADYTVIVWWAEAMSNAAQKLAEILLFFEKNPKPDLENNTLKKLRAELANHLRTVAADTKDQFGQPWGMIAMDMLSGGRSEATVVYTGPVISLTRMRRAVTAGAPG